MQFLLKPGHEVRGEMIRIYPTKKDEEILETLSDDLRTAWNWLVKQTEETLEANRAYAIKQGLVSPPPTIPNYSGMEPEVAKATAAAFREARGEWGKKCYEATKGLPGCEFRNLTGKPGSDSWVERLGVKYDYQGLQCVLKWKHERMIEEGFSINGRSKPGSRMFQKLAENYKAHILGQRRKKFRRSFDPMPLQVSSGDCFELGNFGSRGNSHKNETKDFYNCRVKINGLKIRGRLPGRLPQGRVLEGVSLTKKADGWWASIKQEVPIRTVPAPTPQSVVGLDVGLVNIVAISEVRIATTPEAKTFQSMGQEMQGSEPIVVSNKRDGVFSERIAGLQAQAQAFRNVKDFANADKKTRKANRLQLQQARNAKHQIYNEVLKPLAMVETIKIEKLNDKIGQMGGSRKISVMRLVAHLLTERYRNRVREVLPHFTSQDCSQCGERSKETWSYEHGRTGECPFCKYRADRDINAARNIACKPAITLTS